MIDDKGLLVITDKILLMFPLLWMNVQDMRCSPFHRAKASAKEHAKERWGGFYFY